MKRDHLLRFLAERPAINLEEFMRELRFDKRNFYAILYNNRSIPAHRRGDFHRAMKRYGFIFDFDIDTSTCYYPV
jgi:hypothetical protein